MTSKGEEDAELLEKIEKLSETRGELQKTNIELHKLQARGDAVIFWTSVIGFSILAFIFAVGANLPAAFLTVSCIIWTTLWFNASNDANDQRFERGNDIDRHVDALLVNAALIAKNEELEAKLEKSKKIRK
jgi:hypothetical protein